MSTGAIIMMVLGCGFVWGGVIIACVAALAIEKKSKAKGQAF